MSEEFDKLVLIMEKLRSKEGCPWDREQTSETLKQFVLEECYELIEAIELNVPEKIEEELGDLLFQVIFLSQIYKEQKLFNITSVINKISEKLIRRHPHVFKNERADNPEEVLKLWSQIKKNENNEDQRVGKILNDVPKKQPSLLRAHQISQRVVNVGFEWERIEDIITKLHEEITELKREVESGDTEKQQDEIGDVLFTIVNISRRLKINSEFALHRMCDKFIERFGYIENELIKSGKEFQNSNLEEMEALWQQSKKILK